MNRPVDSTAVAAMSSQTGFGKLLAYAEARAAAFVAAILNGMNDGLDRLAFSLLMMLPV
jgi:hypothetical protein